jgi:signal transduction histidine kinase
VAWVSSFVNPPRFFGGGPYRLSVIFSAACVISGGVLFAVVYWQTKAFEMRRIGDFVMTESSTVSQGSTDDILWAVGRRAVQQDPDKFEDAIFAGLFASNGSLIAGNLTRMPPRLPPDSKVHEIEVTPPGEHARPRKAIAVARPLADGRILVFGRGIRVLTTLEGIVGTGLILGAIPAIGLVMTAGIWLSRHAQWRVKAVNLSIQRIMEGHVQERLPVHGMADDFDHLANGVNRMLAEIESLLTEVQAVGDNIAHDLRTPLARVRTLLERGRDRAKTKDDLIGVIDRAVSGLDQAQSIITALLRIGEIEGGQRKSGFGHVDLGELVQEAGELYSPMAEAEQIQFDVQVSSTAVVHGDRDLLIEVIANLLDNAIKFTPPGGTVHLQVADHEDGPVIRVSDTGPGIPPEERAAVMRRFYRVDKSRHIRGNGLGLSIVLAIVRLHQFDIVVGDAHPGCCFELLCYARPRSETEAVRVPALKRLVLPWIHRTPKPISEPDNALWLDGRAAFSSAPTVPD